MENCGFILNPEKKPEIEIALTVSEGELAESANQYDEDLQFATEAENEVPGLDTCYTPYQIKIQIPANSEKEVSLICHVEAEENISYDGVTKDLVKDTADLWHWGMDVTSHAAFTVLENNKNFFAELIKNADCKDELTEILTVASNQLLSHRESTGLTTVLAGLPWFTDWGRDTMIAFTGLVLSTGRFEKAEEILLTFAKYVDHGMVPNMFPDNGQDPLYNTVDASLWYFYAVHKYLEYNNKPEAYEFIKENIYPALKEIIEAYKKGTLFSIYMEEDGCLYDVIDGDDKDASIRPNQIYAVSIPYTMLDEAKAKAVVDVVKEKLFVGVGLRSLDPAHKEYHPIIQKYMVLPQKLQKLPLKC